MKIARFEDIDAWRVARELVQRVYEVSEKGEVGEEFNNLYDSAVQVKSLIGGFIRYLRADRSSIKS